VPHNYLNQKLKIQPTICSKSSVNYEASGRNKRATCTSRSLVSTWSLQAGKSLLQLLRIELTDLIAIQQDKIMSAWETAQVEAGLQGRSERHQGASFIFFSYGVGSEGDLIF